MSADVTIIAHEPAILRRVRLAKMARVLLAAGYRIAYRGWRREAADKDKYRWDEPRVDERTIFAGGGYAGRFTRAYYPLWMVRVFFHVLFTRDPRTFFCLGFETAFPALVASKLRPARIIFDDADRFSMIFSLPGPLHKLLVALERWTSRNVALHIVPGLTRYEWRHERMVVLRNTPAREDFDWAARHGATRPEADLVVYVNGWISASRGAAPLLEALPLVEGQEIRLAIIAAGSPTDEAGQRLLDLPITRNMGKLEQREALCLYSASDVTLTYYDPAIPINRHAESNKWGDAIFLGQPFIVNSEVETAQHFVKAGAAYEVPFGDARALADLLVSLARDPARLEQARAAAASMRDAYRPFEEQFADLLTRALPLS